MFSLLSRSLTSKHTFRPKQWKRADGVNLPDSISSLCLLLMISALRPLPKRSEARQLHSVDFACSRSSCISYGRSQGRCESLDRQVVRQEWCISSGLVSEPRCVCVTSFMYAVPSIGLLALAYHNAQLQASAFREEFDTEAFEDLTRPKYDMIHKVWAIFVAPRRR